MRKQLKFLLLTVSILFTLAFILFVFNQIAQASQLAGTLSPWLGKLVAWGLTVLFLALMFTPVYLYWRLPQALIFPADATDESAKQAYFQKIGRRMASNRLLTEHALDYSRPDDLQKALLVLDARADDIIRTTARSVFLTTAISQNGKLDAFTVLVTHSKMVWDIAHVYYQRPAPRDMMALYANVGAATFLATQVEDIDITEQLEPVIGTVVQNSALKSVPFVGAVSSTVVDSLLEGTINAFLTLRVGILSKRYCGAMESFDVKMARKAAYREAAVMLRSLVVQSSGQVISAILKTTRKAGADTVRSGVEAAGQATNRVRHLFTGWITRLRNTEAPRPEMPSDDV